MSSNVFLFQPSFLFFGSSIMLHILSQCQHHIFFADWLQLTMKEVRMLRCYSWMSTLCKLRPCENNPGGGSVRSSVSPTAAKKVPKKHASPAAPSRHSAAGHPRMSHSTGTPQPPRHKIQACRPFIRHALHRRTHGAHADSPRQGLHCAARTRIPHRRPHMPHTQARTATPPGGARNACWQGVARGRWATRQGRSRRRRTDSAHR